MMTCECQSQSFPTFLKQLFKSENRIILKKNVLKTFKFSGRLQKKDQYNVIIIFDHETGF
jgi:hypothetical protein